MLMHINRIKGIISCLRNYRIKILKFERFRLPFVLFSSSSNCLTGKDRNKKINLNY